MVAGQGGGAVLDGVLERVTFANPETGYTIARIAPERGSGAGAELVTAVGPLLGAQVGEFLRLTGRWSVPPQVRPAVRGALLRHGAARHGRGHPEVPGLGPDQGHRPGDGRADGGPFRRGHHARHRRRAGPADRGSRAGPQAHRDDRRRLGRAEGDQGSDDLPARRRGVDVAGGADLQEIRRRVGGRGAVRAVPAGRGRVGHRVQDRGHDRRRGRHRPRQPGADQGRAGLHPVRGGRRRALLPARPQPDHRCRQDPRRARRADHPVPGRAGRRRRGDPRDGPRPGAGRIAGSRHLPAALLPGRTIPGARPAPPARHAGRPAQRVRRRRLGQGAGLAVTADRRRARPRTSRRGPARPDLQGRGADRRPRLREVVHRAVGGGAGPRQGGQDRAGRADRPGGQAARRTGRPRGGHHPPAAAAAARRRAVLRRHQSAGRGPGSGGRDLDGRRDPGQQAHQGGRAGSAPAAGRGRGPAALGRRRARCCATCWPPGRCRPCG